jgi:hypothetical protein
MTASEETEVKFVEGEHAIEITPAGALC